MVNGESAANCGSIIKISGLQGRYLNVNGIRTVDSVTGTDFVVSAPVVIDMSLQMILLLSQQTVLSLFH